MYYEWDEAKRLRNIAKHGLDFVDAPTLFDGPHLAGGATTINGETRLLATGMLRGVAVTTIYTVRGATIRVISMRRARRDERARVQAIFG